MIYVYNTIDIYVCMETYNIYIIKLDGVFFL